MGQYHYIVNFTKKQYLHPHVFGDGLKLTEFAYSNMGVMTALAYLLAQSNGLGGGDFSGSQWTGAWAGDSIAIVGDYDESKLHSIIHEQSKSGVLRLAETGLDEPLVWDDVSLIVLDAMLGSEVEYEEYFLTPPDGNERMKKYVMARRRELWMKARPHVPWPGDQSKDSEE